MRGEKGVVFMNSRGWAILVGGSVCCCPNFGCAIQGRGITGAEGNSTRTSGSLAHDVRPTPHFDGASEQSRPLGGDGSAARHNAQVADAQNPGPNGGVETPTGVTGQEAEPAPGAQRFTVNGSIVHDQKLKIVWQKDTSPKKLSYSNAEAYCSGLTLGSGLTWRLPEDTEVSSASAEKEAVASTFADSSTRELWTDTPFPGNPMEDNWTASMVEGLQGGSSRQSPHSTAFVRCVARLE